MDTLDHGHGHDNPRQIEALAYLMAEYAEQNGQPITDAQAHAIAKGHAKKLDIAGKGSIKVLIDGILAGDTPEQMIARLEPLRGWVAEVREAGPFMEGNKQESSAANCGGQVCC